MYTKEVFNNKMNSWINIDAENTDELMELIVNLWIIP